MTANPEMRVSWRAGVGFVPLALLLLAGCIDLGGPPSRSEVAWAKSPDGRTHAILVETNGGATTSYGYRVELHPADHLGEAPVDAGGLYRAVRNSCAFGVDLRWLDANTLALRFYSADKAELAREVTVAGKPIKIIAQSGTLNAAAPCGAMQGDSAAKGAR